MTGETVLDTALIPKNKDVMSRIGRSSLGRIAAASLLTLGIHTATETYAAPEAGATTVFSNDYPDASMPCEHAPYNVTGSCANYDWGPVHTAAYGDSSTNSSRGYGYRNCTDGVAYWVGKYTGTEIRGWGNAAQWDTGAPSSQVIDGTTLTNIEPGDIAQSDDGASGYGHVGFVTAVTKNSNGTITSITTAEMNRLGTGLASTDNIYDSRNSVGKFDRGSGYDWDHFIDVNGAGKGLNNEDLTSNTPPPPSRHSFNGDKYADLTLLTKWADNGLDAHFFPGANTPLQTEQVTRSMPGSSNWSWDAVKTAEADFNGDGYTDIAMVHQLPDDGADIHVLYGNSTPFQYSPTNVRNLPHSAGWSWSQMIVEAGRYNGDNFADLAILHQRTDGGMDAHVLFGSTGIPLQTSNSFMRPLPGTAGWRWVDTKTATGDFNGDGFDDIAIIHKTADQGADIHLLTGANSPFANQNTFTKSLPNAAGWLWALMKPEGSSD